MKKYIKIIVSIILIFNLTQICCADENKNSKPLFHDSEQVNTVIMSLLMPEIQNAVNLFYSQYLSSLPSVTSYLPNDKIISIEDVHTIVVEVMPYVGPHISVGKDRITLKVDFSGNVQVEKFEHLESYDLHHYKDIIIKPLP